MAEFMAAVMGVHSHYHRLISDLFSSHKLFFSALDRVSGALQTLETSNFGFVNALHIETNN